MAPSPIQGLTSAAAVAGDGAAIIFAAGSRNSSTVNLINTALDIKLTPPRYDLPAQGFFRSSKQSLPTLIADASPSGPLVLALEGLDAADSPSPLDNTVALAVSLAGAIVLTVRFPDLARSSATRIPALMTAIETSLALRMSGAASPLPTKRLLVIAVRDYEEDLASAAEVEAAINEQLSIAFDNIEIPSGFGVTQLSDLYEIETLLLPNHTHCQLQYAEGVRQLRDILHDADKRFADAGLTPSLLQQSVEKIQAALDDKSSKDLPAERELNATFACNAVIHNVLEKHRNNAKRWKATVDAGRIIRNFGAENDRLIEATLNIYDKDASPHASTRAFQRKKEELKGCLLSDSYAMFAKQILKVRENAYQVFRAKLARIRINDQVEKNVRGAVKDAEEFFVEHGESLRSKLGSWRFDNERHELVNHMRDDATERLQLARLQGNYVPHIRTPIAFAFHTLLLAPFGRDSRFAHPHAEDMKQTYDPDKIKQAGLMRLRAMQRNRIIPVGRGASASREGVLDQFGQLFEGEEEEEE